MPVYGQINLFILLDSSVLRYFAVSSGSCLRSGNISAFEMLVNVYSSPRSNIHHQLSLLQHRCDNLNYLIVCSNFLACVGISLTQCTAPVLMLFLYGYCSFNTYFSRWSSEFTSQHLNCQTSGRKAVKPLAKAGKNKRKTTGAGSTNMKRAA